MILSILAISCATVSAATVDNGIIDDQSDSINVDDLAVDDSINDEPQLEEISLKAANDGSETTETLGASYTNPYEYEVPMFDPDHNWSENHHYELKDENGNVYTPSADALEFLSHFREISGGYAYRENPQHPLDLYWTALEDGTILLIENDRDNNFKPLHATLTINGHTYKATDEYINIRRTDGSPYKYLAVVVFTGISETTSGADFYTNRNKGPPINLPGVVTVANSTNITLWVNDKFEDTIYLGATATLHNTVLYIPSLVEIENGIVYYNVTAPNGDEIIIPCGTSAPGGTIAFHPDQVGDYKFKAWYPEYINDATGEHNFESHSNVVILHVIEPPETVNVTVYKVWEDGNNADGIRPESVTVTLTGSDGYTYTATIRQDGNRWSYTFKDLPAYLDGELITYTVKEDSVPKDYDVRYDGLVIYNNHTLSTKDVTVSKVWDDGSDRDGIRPDNVTFVLYADGESIEEITFRGSGNVWYYTFHDLPVHSVETGEEIVYTIEEPNVPTGYEITDHTQYSITNDHRAERTEVIVTKVWEDDSNRDNIRPDDLVLFLTGDLDGFTYYSQDYAVITKSGNTWTYNFTNIRKYWGGGQLITYNVTEQAVPEGYEVTYDQGTLTVTNTHEIETTQVTVNKVWEDDDNRDGLRPTSVTFTLTGDDGKTYTYDLVEIEGWTHTFENLPKNNKGEEIVYTVDEAAFEHSDKYIKSIDGYTITNTHAPERYDVEVTKIWDDDNNRDGKRPTSLDVTLDGGDETYTGTISGQSGDTWTYTFEDVLKYRNGGQLITYTVGETIPNGYTANYDGLTVTNTHAPELINVTVTKIWDDDNNRDGKRPSSLEVTLNGDDETYTGTISGQSGDTWTYKFENVHKYLNGEEIVYTVGETVPNGYTATYDGLTVTNKHDIATKDVEVTKVWDDSDNLELIRPDSIDITLSGGDQSNSTTMSGEGNTWTYVFKDMPVYYDGGKTIIYNVVEKLIPYLYDVTYDQETLTITNTHELMCDVGVTLTVNKNEVYIGEIVEYVITVTNHGPINATGVFVNSTILPEGLTYISDNLTNSNYDEQRSKLLNSKLRGSTPSYDKSTGIWTIGDLAVGEQVQLAILASADVVGDHNIHEHVTADSDVYEPNNDDETNVKVLAVTDLELDKSVDKTEIKVGDTVTYTFTVTNNGPSDATGVKVTDKNILKHEFVSASSSDYDSATGVWTIGDLANGESVTLTVTVRINEVGVFENTAIVTGNEHDNDTSNNNDSSEKVNVTEEEPTEEPITPEEPIAPKEASVLPKAGNPLFVLITSLMVLIGAIFVRRE